jgi:serine/threonine protein kinase
LGSENYGPEIDVWSLGCIFAELFYGKIIFYCATPEEIMYLIYLHLGTPEYLISKTEYNDDFIPRKSTFEPKGFKFIQKTNPYFDQTAHDLLIWMLNVNPLSRPTCQEILRHKYFN